VRGVVGVGENSKSSLLLVSATLSLSFDGFVSFASAVSFSEAEEETGVGAVGVRAPGDDDGDNEALGAAFGRDLRPVT